MVAVSYRSKHRRSIDEENPYWLSFSDIMSGLLVIFIMASLYLMIELQDKLEKFDVSIMELSKANQTRTQVLHEIQQELLQKGVFVEVVDNKSVLRIPADQLHFKKGKSDIPANKTEIVHQIGKTLFEVISKGERMQYIDTIFIEGHTDSMRAGKYIAKGNWGLSTFRAITVWNFWRNNPEYGENISGLLNRKGESIFSVSGYAATRRVDILEEDSRSMELNRRIDIRFTMKQPEYQSIVDIKNTVK